MFLPQSDIRTELEGIFASVGGGYDGGLGNPAFPPSEQAVNARISSSRLTRANYYGQPRTPSWLTEAIINYAEEVDGVHLQAPQVAASWGGSRCGLAFFCMYYRQNNGIPMRWAVEAPGYGGHCKAVEAGGGIFQLIKHEKDSFLDVLDSLLRHGTISVDGFVVNAVGNPTAHKLSPEEVKQAVRISQEYGKLLYFDGAYQHVTRSEFVKSPLLEVAGELNSNIICSVSASKESQYASLGGAAFMGDTYWVNAFAEVQAALREGGDPANLAAFKACLSDFSFIRQTADQYRVLADSMCESFAQIGWPLPEWQGSIFNFPKIPAGWLSAGKTSLDFARAAVQRGNLFYPDPMFNGDGERVRIRLERNGRSMAELAESMRPLIAMYN